MNAPCYAYTMWVNAFYVEGPIKRASHFTSFITLHDTANTKVGDTTTVWRGPTRKLRRQAIADVESEMKAIREAFERGPAITVATTPLP
jgi:hypothetical protein